MYLAKVDSVEFINLTLLNEYVLLTVANLVKFMLHNLSTLNILPIKLITACITIRTVASFLKVDTEKLVYLGIFIPVC